MRNSRSSNSRLFMLVLVFLLTSATCVHALTGRQSAESALSSLKASACTLTTRNVATLSWTWLEANYYDETYPLTVDLVGSNFKTAKKIIYMLPGGGVNFRSSFFTPIDDNITQFFLKYGYLVVGITPREDNVPTGLSSYRFMADWGLAKHRNDIRRIISTIQARVGLPYVVLGHSFGAAYALDYASAYPNDLEKVIALDIYSFDPYSDNGGTSDMLSDEYDALIQGGNYADSSYSDIKSLMLISLLLPRLDSGYSRGSDPAFPGNFTYEGLLYYSMIYSATLPGVLTDITGLPAEWPMIGGYVSGKYTFASNPFYDTYSLNHSDLCNLREASIKVGSGLVPWALYRDFFAVNAGISGEINWSAIRKPVLWINTGLGYGPYAYGAQAIRASGNSQVFTASIPGYGHLDILAGRTARADVWWPFFSAFLGLQ